MYKQALYSIMSQLDSYKVDRWYNLLNGNFGLYESYDNSMQKLKGLYIVRREDRNQYAAVTKQQLEDLLNIPDLSLHEVILPREQKMRYDIDADLQKLSDVKKGMGCDYSLEDIYKFALNDIITAIKLIFANLFAVDLFDDDLVICNSTDPAVKFSAHIIICNYHFSSDQECKKVFEHTISQVSERYKPLLDEGIYSRNHNFRLVNSVKGTRVKKITSGHVNLESVCSYIDPDYSTLLSIEVNTKTRENADSCLPECVKQSILKLAQDHIPNVMAAFEYSRVNNNFIQFTRKYASHCEFCNRVHEKQTSLYLVYRVNGEDLIISYGCTFVKGETREIGSIAGGAVVAGLTNGNERKYLKKNINGDTNNTAYAPYQMYELKKTLERRYLVEQDLLQLNAFRKNVYDSDTLQDIENDEVVMVRAGMGVGKTVGLRKHLDEYYPVNELNPKRIVMVTFRQTLARSYKENFSEFTVYMDSREKLISDDRVIVQFESTNRLSLFTDPPDLVILDESESIIEQLSSGLSGDKMIENYAKFEYLIKYSKRLICMDATIGNRTYALIKHVRSENENDICAFTLHWNMFKKQAGKIYNITVDVGSWLSEIKKALNRDKKIAIATNILSDANTLCKILENEYPHKKVQLYSSETRQSLKTRHFEDVNTYWKMVDVLIYTPTVSAGVSFTEHYFDHMFAYFSDRSCSVENCIQMLGRIRNIASDYHIFVSYRYKNKLVDREKIKQNITNARNNILSNYDNYGIRVQYNRDGKRYVYTSSYFQLHVENIVNANLSENNFLGRLVYYLKQFGGTIIPNVIEDCEEIAAVYESCNAEVFSELIANVCNAADITQAEYDNRQALVKANTDSDDEESEVEHMHSLHEIKKYEFRKSYRYDGPINEKMLRKYWSAKRREVFKNLSRIYPDPSRKIQAIIQRQREMLMMLKNKKEKQHEPADIMRDYDGPIHYRLHSIATNLFEISMDERAKTVIGYNQIKDNLGKILAETETFSSYIKVVYEELGLPAPKIPAAGDEEYYAECFEKLATLLKKYYDISLSRKNTLYTFRHSPYFVTYDTDYKPNILTT